MAQLSTAELSNLPEPSRLRQVMQSLAALDAVISPDWDLRYYSFNSRWADTEMMGSMRTGSGDSLYVIFNNSGALIKGFDHELRNWDISSTDAYKSVPSCFSAAVAEVAFCPDDVTFCYWREFRDDHWYVADIQLDDDGSESMISELDGNPESYLAFARSYYEADFNLESVSAIYNHAPMTLALAYSLNPNIKYRPLAEDLVEIGYPIAPSE